MSEDTVRIIPAMTHEEMLEQTAIVWDYEYPIAKSLSGRPYQLGMVSMGPVVGVDAFTPSNYSGDAMRDKKIIIVNLYLATNVVQQLKKTFPDKIICVSPDFTIDQVDAGHRGLTWEKVFAPPMWCWVAPNRTRFTMARLPTCRITFYPSRLGRRNISTNSKTPNPKISS
jgi:hypothetical protein